MRRLGSRILENPVNEVIERLMAGDEEIVVLFRKAKGFWADFFSVHGSENAADLAKSIGTAQSGYEVLFDFDRGLAKGTMPFTALGYLYDTGAGFEDNRGLAIRTVEAFMSSFVSIEVKGATRDAARQYNLDDDPDVRRSLSRW